MASMKRASSPAAEEDGTIINPKRVQMWKDPVQGLAAAPHEFGEHGGVNMSIEASATFTVMKPEITEQLFAGELGPADDHFIYSRHFNPTVLNLGRQIAAMEGVESAYCTSSGMSAIAAVLLQLCSQGDHIVASNRLYGGTHALLSHFLPRTSDITSTFVDLASTPPDSIRSAFNHRTKVLYFESMSNPTLCIADIPLLSSIGHEKGVTVVVDNTFGPIILSPARLGADVVVHSVSKYISGQADIIAGAVCGSEAFIKSMMGLQQGSMMLLGPAMNAKVAFEISGRLPHLACRMQAHCERALLYATRMKKLGLQVIYPGLEEHPQHELLKKMVNPGQGFGGIVAIDLGTKKKAYQFIEYLQNRVRFGFMAVSLGYSETLMSCPGPSTSSELSAEEQDKSGISPGLVRMSVGYTGTPEQRWEQLLQALVDLEFVAAPEGADKPNSD